MSKSRKKLYADLELSKQIIPENTELNEDTKPYTGKKANKLRQQTELHKPIHGMSQYERTNAYAELAKRHKANQSAGKRRRTKNKSIKRRKTRRKRGGETDAEIRTRRQHEIDDKKLNAIESGQYLHPDKRGKIVRQNQDVHKLTTHYNDDMNFAKAEQDGLTFGGKKRHNRKKTRKACACF
jgi:hypothetical protein